MQPSTDKLTPKQEAFCRAYVERGNASAAYRAAFEPKKMKAKTINEKASRLLATPKISARVRELQEKLAEHTGVTVDGIVDKLEQAYAGSMVFGQFNAAVSAQMGIAKLHGLVIERKVIEDDREALRDLTNEQILARISETLRDMGIDASLLLQKPAGKA